MTPVRRRVIWDAIRQSGLESGHHASNFRVQVKKHVNFFSLHWAADCRVLPNATRRVVGQKLQTVRPESGHNISFLRVKVTKRGIFFLVAFGSGL